MTAKRPRPDHAEQITEALAMLDELYAQLPKIECKGRCWDSCTAIDASELERQRVRDRGVELPPKLAFQRLRELIDSGDTPRCPALSPLNTCQVYDVRPFICRAFGTVYQPGTRRRDNGMMCDHGCTPEGTISPDELYRVLIEIERLSREVTGVSRMPELR